MDLKLPNLGEGADSGTVVTVFVKEGDTITKDQPILELENEKAVATIPSTASGKVGAIYVKPGDKISVGQRILSLGDGAQAAPSAPRAPKATAAAPPPREQPLEMEGVPAPGREPVVAEPEAAPPPPGSSVAASPSIRKLARDLGIDLTRVRGSARGGRILLEDVRAYIARLQRLALEPRTPAQPAVATPQAQAAPKPEPIDFSKWGPVTRAPASQLRQVIARRMAESWHAVPRVTQFDEADITALNDLRKKFAPAYEKAGTRLTLTSFAVKVVAETLKRHPLLNSSLDEVAQEIVYKQHYHIGIAVDTEAGLLVPVIRDADKKSLLEISKALEEMAQKARERKVSAEDLKGGTFTISNQGGIGGGHFTPIVNRPEVAILGLGRGALKAVVREEKIVPRLMLPIAVSYDHRVIDGGVAARFTVDLVKAFESFPETEAKL